MLNNKELRELILDSFGGKHQGRYLKMHRTLNQCGLIPKYYQAIEPAHAAICLFMQATYPGGDDEKTMIRWFKTNVSNALKVMEDRKQLHAVNVLAGIIASPALAERISGVLIDSATGVLIVHMVDGNAIQTDPVWPVPGNYHIRTSTRITAEFLRHLAAELEGVESEIINQIFQN